jgi:hypothetical protein
MENHGFKRADGRDVVPDQLTAFVQAWLFFGALTEVLGASGIAVNTEDFVLGPSNRLTVTTVALPRYLEQWSEQERSNNERIRGEHFRKVSNRLP